MCNDVIDVIDHVGTECDPTITNTSSTDHNHDQN